MRQEHTMVRDREGVAVLTAGVDDQRVAFPLRLVHEVLPAMETTRIAHAPEVLRGVINLRGEALPVLDLRVRLGLPSRAPDPHHHVLVCRVRDRLVGVWVDRAQDVETVPMASVAPLPADSPARHVSGVALIEDGLLLVADVDSFLSIEEFARLDLALAEEGAADA